MKNKQLRRFVVFLSCLSLILSMAVPAYAFSPDLFYTSVNAGVAVAGTLQSLGITAGTETDTFSSVVNDAVGYLENAGNFVVDGTITMSGIKSSDTGIYRSYVQESLAQSLLQWVFDVELVKQKVFQNPIEGETFVPSNYKYAYLATWQDTRDGSLIYRYCYTNNGPIYLYISSDGTVRIKCDYSWFTNTPQKSMFSSRTAGESVGFNSYLRFVSFEPFGTLNPPSYGSDRDITVSEIQTPFVEGLAVPLFELDTYKGWTANSIAVPFPGTSANEDWVPVSIGGTSVDSNVLSGTQVGAQAGTVVDGLTWTESESVPDVTPGTATLSDILSAVLALPKAIVSSITEALSKFFGISGTADSFGISLTDFFPFCIPFDIYDFLSVLSADPVAPVFHWELPVPQLGRTFEIDVDLSAWDPVAAVFRTFELLAFVVGLGMVTREKFLRS